jgi:hypothetical protein
MDDLEIPDFLKRTGKRLTDAQVKEIIGGVRVWAPVRSVLEIKKSAEKIKQEKPSIFPNDPDLPVTVVTKKDGIINRLFIFENFKEFYEEHNFHDYPYRKMVSAPGETIIQVNVSIWVERAEKAEPDQPTFQMNTKDRVWQYAELMWTEAGKPTDKKLILKMRKDWMIELAKEGINRSTCSCEFGQWMKVRLS